MFGTTKLNFKTVAQFHYQVMSSYEQDIETSRRLSCKLLLAIAKTSCTLFPSSDWQLLKVTDWSAVLHECSFSDLQQRSTRQLGNRHFPLKINGCFGLGLRD